MQSATTSASDGYRGLPLAERPAEEKGQELDGEDGGEAGRRSGSVDAVVSPWRTTRGGVEVVDVVFGGVTGLLRCVRFSWTRWRAFVRPVMVAPATAVAAVATAAFVEVLGPALQVWTTSRL